MSNVQNPLRLKKRHGSGKPSNVTASDGERLVRVQSMRGALVAGLIAILVFGVLWVSVTDLSNRIFPWFTAILGFMVGHAVRLGGRGVDWRFPTLAAFLTLVGSVASNVAVSASVSAEGFGTSTVEVLLSVTSMTWPVFFDEVLGVADAFYAIIGAALAAFFANRRLSRQQYFALRLWREESSNG